jgi:hypothetical protein
MNKKYLPYLILACALGLGISAAYYSIVGLSMLFAGVALPVIIMASFLEASKLTIATLLHSYWDKINNILKAYLTTAVVILSIITSAGIYGLLSSGYQDTANKSNIVEQQISSLETKKQSYIKIKEDYLHEKESISKSTSELRTALSKSTVLQSVDKKGNIITRESKGNRKTFEKQLESATQTEEKLQSKLDIVNDSIFNLEAKILEVKTNNTVSNELGPLKYLSNLTGQPMDKVINWFLIIIMLVFDPLAIALIVASNFTFTQIRKNEEQISINDIMVDTLEEQPESEPEFELEPERIPQLPPIVNPTPQSFPLSNAYSPNVYKAKYKDDENTKEY